MESSTWTLAGGSGCVFALAIVLNHQPWQVALVVVALAVAAWAWQAPVVEGAAIGGIGWLCVTGFDIYGYGDLKITGQADVLRMAVLIGAGALAALIGRTVRSVTEPAAEPAETQERSRSLMVPAPRGAVSRTPVLTEESRDG